jgi:hypothetical protein
MLTYSSTIGRFGRLPRLLSPGEKTVLSSAAAATPPVFAHIPAEMAAENGDIKVSALDGQAPESTGARQLLPAPSDACVDHA